MKGDAAVGATVLLFLEVVTLIGWTAWSIR
jgi:hypothetical protein